MSTISSSAAVALPPALPAIFHPFCHPQTITQPFVLWILSSFRLQILRQQIFSDSHGNRLNCATKINGWRVEFMQKCKKFGAVRNTQSFGTCCFLTPATSFIAHSSGPVWQMKMKIKRNQKLGHTVHAQLSLFRFHFQLEILPPIQWLFFF